MYNSYDPWAIPAILTCIVAIAYFCLPTEKVNKWIFRMQAQEETTEYLEACKNFDNDYDKDNPATRDEALKEGFLLIIY